MADAATTKEEQARKAHALAEKCFLAGDVHGARQWMQSAVRLAPALPGTAQIVAAYDVHAAAAAAARRSPPDSWYAVLGLHPAGPTITHDDIKRHHRRLCLLVHPDKNPCAAADGSFKLVQAAWDALSARHPPGAPAPPAAAKQPPRPPQQRQQARPPRAPPEPRPRPTVVQMPRRAAPAPARAATSYAQQASKATGQKPPRPPPPTAGRRSTSPIEGRCPTCGACTIHGRKSRRCGSCQWSPMDNRPPDDDDDDFFEEDYY